MCLIVPISTGKTMDGSVMCHTQPDCLLALLRPFHALPAHSVLFFLSVPLFSIRKQNIIAYKEVDTHNHEPMFAPVMLHPFVPKMKRHRQTQKPGVFFFTCFMRSNRLNCTLAGSAAQHCWSDASETDSGLLHFAEKLLIFQHRILCWIK